MEKTTICHNVTKDREGTYYTIPFTVPDHVESFTLTCDYPRTSQGITGRRKDACIIDLGIIDCGGRFIGWSGSARKQIWVGEFSSTNGYFCEPIKAGQWQIIVGAYKLDDEKVSVEYTIEFEEKKRKLYYGDLHMHSTASDGKYTVSHSSLPWNGPMRAANVRALRKWTELLSSGRKIPAVGGSDFHRMMSPVRIGRPVNGVYSEDASSQGLLDAISSGHLFVASSLRGPSLLLTCGDRMMGDTVTTGEKSVEITVKAERLQGCRLFLVTAQGENELSGENAVLPSNCVFVYAKAVKSGIIRAVTNPVYLRHTAHV